MNTTWMPPSLCCPRINCGAPGMTVTPAGLRFQSQGSGFLTEPNLEPHTEQAHSKRWPLNTS